MSKDHVCIPRFMENKFADKNEITWVYYYQIDFFKWIHTKSLGIDYNHFDKNVESKILGEGIENYFAKFVNEYLTCENKYSLLNKNINLLEKYFSITCNRIDSLLNVLNQNSRTLEECGKITTSEAIKFQYNRNINYFDILKGQKSFHPLINDESNNEFINNSIGLGSMKLGSSIAIVIPIDTKNAILITNSMEYSNVETIYTSNIGGINLVNRGICAFEFEIGYGFIFSKSKSNLSIYIEYMKKLLLKNNHYINTVYSFLQYTTSFDSPNNWSLFTLI